MKYFKNVVIFILLLVFLLCFLGCGCQRVSTTEGHSKKEEIVFAVGRDNTRIYSQIAQKFSNENEDINVKVVELGSSSEDFYRNLTSILAGDEVQVDLCLAEDVWINDFVKNNYIKNLNSFVESDSDDYPECFRDIMFSGKDLYAVPYELDVESVYYADNVFNDGTDISDLSGICSVVGSDSEDMICCVSQFINYTGGIEDGIKMYKDFYVKSSGAGFSDFKSGKIPSVISHSAKYYDAVEGFKKLDGYVTVKPFVAANSHHPITGRVHCLVVSQNTNNLYSVEKFLRYLTETKTYLNVLRDRGTSPVRLSDYNNELVLDYNRINDGIKSYIGKIGLRPGVDDYAVRASEFESLMNAYLDDDAKLNEVCEFAKSFFD